MWRSQATFGDVKVLNGMKVAGESIYPSDVGQISGSRYFLDSESGMDDDGKWGKSWEKPFKTMAYAMAVSHADIGRGSDRWTRRNAIYCAGGPFVEDLGVLAQKTDIIGVGSYNLWAGACLEGNHVPATTTAAGCRFINMYFKAPATGGDIFTLNATVNPGICFYGCRVNGYTATATAAFIVATAVDFMQVEECHIEGNFSDAVIEFGTGSGRGTRIVNNFISGANEGIHAGAGFTSLYEMSQISGNRIVSTLAGINDASSKFYVFDNRIVTLAAPGSAGAGGIVCNQYLASGNRITCSNTAFTYPLLGEDANGEAG